MLAGGNETQPTREAIALALLHEHLDRLEFRLITDFQVNK